MTTTVGVTVVSQSHRVVYHVLQHRSRQDGKHFTEESKSVHKMLSSNKQIQYHPKSYNTVDMLHSLEIQCKFTQNQNIFQITETSSVSHLRMANRATDLQHLGAENNLD